MRNYFSLRIWSAGAFTNGQTKTLDITATVNAVCPQASPGESDQKKSGAIVVDDQESADCVSLRTELAGICTEPIVEMYDYAMAT